MAEIHGAIGPAGGVSGGLGPVGGYSASIQGAVGPVSEGIRDGAVTTPKIADLAVTTAKIADAAVTISKLAAEVIDATLTVSGAAADAQATGAALALKAAAADLQTLAGTVAGIKSVTDALGAAANYGVLNALTQETAGVNVLDAAQGKALADSISAMSGAYHYTSVTGTTTGVGNLRLTGSAGSITILSAWVTSGGYMCIPFTDANGRWYAKVLVWNSTSYSVLASGEVTVNYLYRSR